MIARRQFWFYLAALPICSFNVGALEVQFDRPSGFCDSEISVALSVKAQGAVVYYTTNGARPAPGAGLPYGEPLKIHGTTVLRAMAFVRGEPVSVPATRTYLFARQVPLQTGAQLPQTWGTNLGQRLPAYYKMSAADTPNPGDDARLLAAFSALPSLSIVGDPDDLFGPEAGIYTYPLERGSAWERPVSIEWFEATASARFRSDCGLRIHGASSRRPEVSPKHSFRLSFRKRYGSGELRFAMFGGEPESFDDLILRAGNNNSWLHPDAEERQRADYLRDEWMRTSMRAMGYPAPRGRFVHVYLNGLYWGIYNLCEDPTSKRGAARAGAVDAEPEPQGYDLRKGDRIESGDARVWDRLLSLANDGLAKPDSYQRFESLVDVRELADYLLINLYAGNLDWDRTANWYAVRPRTTAGKFRFYPWDSERILESINTDNLGWDDDESPQRLFQRLCENAEFRALFKSRVEHLCFNDGPLAPRVAAERFRSLAETIREAMPAEAARWGTYRRDIDRCCVGPYDRYNCQQWESEIGRIQNRYFPARLQVVLNQFAERGLIAAPPPK